MWRYFFLKYAEDRRDGHTMEWREFLKKSSEDRRIMMVVFISPLHSPWSGNDFRTWLSKAAVTINKETVMGIIQMVTWGYLVHYYVNYNWFMGIWGFNNEEILSHYKILEKIAREWIDDKDKFSDICGPDRIIPIERRGYTIIWDIYIIRKKLKMTTREINPQIGA